MNKSQKTWLIVGAVSAVVLVICCACGIAGFTWWANPSSERVADNYFEAVQDKDADEVRELTCAARRASVDVPDDDEELLSWEILSSSENGNRATVIARVQIIEDGDTDDGTLTMTLVKEDGDWRVCSIDER